MEIRLWAALAISAWCGIAVIVFWCVLLWRNLDAARNREEQLHKRERDRSNETITLLTRIQSYLILVEGKSETDVKFQSETTTMLTDVRELQSKIASDVHTIALRGK